MIDWLCENMYPWYYILVKSFNYDFDTNKKRLKEVCEGRFARIAFGSFNLCGPFR